VAANSRSLERLTKAFNSGPTDDQRKRLSFIEADVTTNEGLDKLIKGATTSFQGKLSVLVNNAGNAPLGLVFGSDAWSDSSVDATFSVFLRAPVLLLNRSVPLLAAAAKDSGRTSSVINISSVVSERPASGGFVPYSAAKAGLDAITKGAAAELAEKRIRVSSVAPGLIATNFMTTAGLPADAVSAFESQQAAKNIPLKRVGSAEDIAHAVSYLADDARSSWVTGTIISVDGGHRVTSLLA